MKTKVILFAVFLFFNHITGISQIPNGDFEKWDTINGIENPVDWETSNIEGYISVEKTSSLTSGQFAVKVSSTAPSLEGTSPGIAKTQFKPSQIYNVLTASIRIDTIVKGKAEILVNQLFNGNVNRIGYWSKDTISNGIESIEIPLEYTSLDIIEIVIIAKNTLTPTGSTGYAEIVVDDMSMSKTSAANDISRVEFSVFPNPATDYIQLVFPGMNDWSGWQTFNIEGKVVLKSHFTGMQKIDISGLENGLYIIRVEDKKGINPVAKFVIAK